MNSIKNYIILLLTVLLIGGLSTAIVNYKRALAYRNKYEIAKANEKAYNISLSNDKTKAIVLQETLDNLRISNDSLVKELLLIQKKRKIKDKNIKYMSYQISNITRTDTIILKDTIFTNKVQIDTLITDKWYSVNLGLSYPNIIKITPKFKSERYVLISAKKEPINKPSKIFFIRWFQKKHTVVNVDIEEKNPYINMTNQKYIKIIDKW